MIIGFCGLAGSGKSTAARHLESGHDFRVVPFAGPLKAMARAFGLNHREMAGDLKEAPCDMLGGKTPRQFMQMLGTEFGRQMIGEDVWVNAWRRRVREAHLDAIADLCDEAARASIVADDVRFANEAAAIWGKGGIVVRIARPGAGSASGAGHASEAQEFEADCTILNAGSEADFLCEVSGLLTVHADLAWARENAAYQATRAPPG